MNAPEGFHEVDVFELDVNPFKAIGKDFMLITAENPGKPGSPEGKPNAMTAAWGGLGFMWQLPVAFVVIRGEEYRFTRKLVDAASTFSLAFFDPSYRDALMKCGRTHGWDDPNKIESAGLSYRKVMTPVEHDPAFGEDASEWTPFIPEASLVLICEKLYVQEMQDDCHIDKSILEQHYTREGQHALYIVHIKAAFVKD